ncbi:coiled-coil domain-containing protein 87-like [Gigantopelta aegis]|uniref:coiled-coil domain-containing protein 87-like n=1 Tax=Gigantopelta aegis TaxID=1735272 RepID=UPI001B887C2F|nr:coiled-coil domain-containing protein 87-like [Gigantopelta aegis]
MSAQTRTSFKGVVQTPDIEDAKERRKPKKDGNIFPIEWPPYDTNDVKSRIDNVLGPLSLFAPYPHEDEPEVHPDLELERPNTPIDKEIKSQPSSFEMLAQYIRRRIAPKPGVVYMSYEDQQNLAGIIMGEVNGIWPDIRKQIDDPFCLTVLPTTKIVKTAVENKELNRRIAVHIVMTCEKLFHHYLQKAQVLNGRGVFSGPANMSRLKVQLALETNNFLNILRIRRHIVTDMRTKSAVASEEQEEFISLSESDTQMQGISERSYQDTLHTGRLKPRKPKHRTVQQEIKEMTSRMPRLDTSNLMDLVAELPERDLSTPSEYGFALPSRISEKESRMSVTSKEELSRSKVLLKRSSSQPVLHYETLLEELDIDKRVRDDPMLDHELKVLMRERGRLLKDNKKDDVKPKPGTREYITQDLKELVSQKEKATKTIDEDLPPLLQAILRNSKHDDLKERMEKQMKELEEKERQRKEKEAIKIQEPTHPQPATICSKLSDKLVVKTSDIRVSERVCMSSITLSRYATVYNDLIEEIDVNTVKNLDKSLFLSDEIREVYKEIMQTVPHDHLELDNDSAIQPAPDAIQLTGTSASSTLTRKRTERVINSNLHCNRYPPWGSNDAKKWVKTPSNPPKNFQGEDVFPPMTPDPERKAATFMQSENLPVCVAEKMARNYSSWLHWWKSTVNIDDYMKYLSTQETDFLAVLFHFYDSDDDEDEDEGSRTRPGATHSKTKSLKTTTHQRELEAKLNELKAQKNEYKEGYWNCNTVLIGGLGKDPVVEEEKTEEKGDKPADTQATAMTLQERVAMVRQYKQELERSRTSKMTDTSMAASERSFEEIEAPPTPQERLEKVWSHLQMPDKEKLDMAVKYSCDDFFKKLSEAMDQWEETSDLILQRETLLEKLEKFERKASDPNRFFEKSDRGIKRSSVLRLEEARKRSAYYRVIERLDTEIRMHLEVLREEFKDTVTFKGRPYDEKMKWDRIEMLYWLQEERKEHAIKYESMTNQLTLKYPVLDPINVTQS